MSIVSDVLKCVRILSLVFSCFVIVSTYYALSPSWYHLFSSLPSLFPFANIDIFDFSGIVLSPV